ncbi:MAG: beta-ketoacyl synthase N-terminal-like domain-containing protein, partial [Anaerolineales bacterium]
MLHDGVDAVTEIPADRKNMQEYIRSATDAGGQDIHWYGGFVEGIDQFDPQFFGLAPREATLMDPQQRMILEVSWEALERAGQAPDKLKGSQTGIFIGITTNDYGQLTLSTDPSQLDAYTATGGALNVAPGRVAYTLGLQGPSMAIDTACSSSLVAVHLACQSLRNGESNLALAGGVNVLLRPEAFVCFNRWGMMSPAGFCKTFDAGADGFVRGEGCGIIVLKRLSDAITSGDPILAVIRGSAVNQDGRSSGLTVPNGLAQAAVIRTALANAGVQPAKVSYVETHGTGTSLGDPIEVEALGSVLGEGRSQDQPLFLSSVKTNIGHLESAAGMAGLIKVVLAMQNKEIPPHLHLQERSPRIPWPDFPTLIPTQPSPWTADNNSRIAGVSSFGFSGTNAHIVLEEAPALELSQAEIGWPAHLLTLSAKSEPALKQLAARFAQHLTSHPSQSLADVSFTANTGRAQFPHRLAIVAESNEEARKALTAFSSDHEAAGLTAGQIQEADQDKLAFLFTGQGSQYVGMGRQLYETEPAFRQALNQCDELLRPYLHRSILEIIYPDHSESGEPNLLDQTAYTQPALFALEYSLAQLWQSWGIRPAAVMGHSVGEYVAACIAGVFSLEDGLRLIAERGRLMQALPAGGKMAAIFSDRLKVAEVIKPYKEQVSIAAINGPENIVISGAGRAIDTIVETLTEQGISSKYLTVSHAFHSPLMDPILGEFLQIANRIRFNPPKIDLISNISGQPVGEEIVTPDYWQKHVLTPVLFADSIQTLHDQGCRIFLEIGPKPTLLSMGQRCIPDTKSKDQWLPSLRPGQGDWQSLLQTLGTLFVQGINIDWPGFEQTHAKSRQRLILPSYPFQRERYWIDYQKAQNIGPHRTLHPLVHEAMPSPFLQDTVYLSHLAVDSPAYLDDHRVFDLPIFPGTAYLEVMLAATGLALGWKEISLVDVQIERAMTLPENGERLIQTAVSPIQNGQATVRIFSQNENDTWQEHATAIVKPGSPSDLETDPLSLITARCTQEVTPSAYYQQLSDIGLAYGASFCGIQSIQRRDGEAIARVQLPEDVPMAGYSLHPALLDACLQVLGTTLPTLEDRTPANVYVPIGISHFQVFQPGETNLICHASLEVGQGQSEILRGNLRLFDERGVLIALVEGIQLKSISQRDLEQLARKPIADLLYHLRWQPSSGTTATGDLTGHWLILADLEGTGSALAKRLEQSGATTTILTPNDFAVLDPQAYISVLNQVTELGKRSLRGIVHLWGLLEKEISLEASHWGYASALFLAQACLKTASPPRLWFITQGAQAVPENTKDMVHPAQSALWGFARTLALEHGDLRPVILDLEMGAQTPEATIFAELANDAGENQVAWRVGKRYVARLARHQSEADALILPDKPFELIASQQGLLDLISVRLKTTRPPGLREVEIAVHAAGLNFRDVLNALGMYPGQAGKLGNECVGVVTAIGEDVSNVKVGDAVMALASGTFAPTVVAQSEFVFPIPANLSFIESATIPITFLTAYYGLHHLAKIRSGDRILIHAAAGGVGLAAVQLAQRAGAIIYATAGSPEKRAFLRSLGVQYIMNSRSLDF